MAVHGLLGLFIVRLTACYTSYLIFPVFVIATIFFSILNFFIAFSKLWFLPINMTSLKVRSLHGSSTTLISIMSLRSVVEL